MVITECRTCQLCVTPVAVRLAPAALPPGSLSSLCQAVASGGVLIERIVRGRDNGTVFCLVPNLEHDDKDIVDHLGLVKL